MGPSAEEPAQGANPWSRRSGANPQTYNVSKYRIKNEVAAEDRSNHRAIATMAVVSMSQRIVNRTRVGRMATVLAHLGWDA